MIRFFTQLGLGLAATVSWSVGEVEKVPEKQSELRPGQILHLSVAYSEGVFSQLDGFHFIGQNNQLKLPQLGEFSTKGKTMEQLTAEVKLRFIEKSKLGEDFVSLKLFTKPSLKGILVMGYVKKAGELKVWEGMTLLQALEQAGGANAFGTIHRVQLLRGGKAYIYDLKRNAKHRAVSVKPKDILFVPSKKWVGR